MYNNSSAISLSDVVNNYMAASFNNNRKYYINYLAAARLVWKDILRTTLWSVVNKYVEVDKTTTPYSIPAPGDMARLFSINVVDDCNKVQPFYRDRQINTTELTEQKTCKKHGAKGCNGSLCDEVDNMVFRTKEVVIDGQTHYERIYNKVNADGSLFEIREIPVKDYADGTITTITQNSLICNLDVNDDGCILPTDSNKELIITNCGCFLSSCVKKQCTTDIKKSHNKYGFFKQDGDRIYLETKADQVIISYQSDGECSGEILMVPSYAEMALITGIDYRTKAFRPNVNRFEKEAARRDYNREKKDLLAFLNPIIIEEFLNIDSTSAKW